MAEEHIKINPVPTKVKYSGNGVVREFPTGFAFFEDDNIVVYHNGVIINTGYSVTGVGETGGGVVTFDVAPAEGDKIVIIRKVAIERVTDFQEGGAFRAKNINDELDRQTAFCQQIQEEIDRCVKVEVTDDQTPEELLTEVYGKLDSATEVAQNAVDAANAATDAVASAEKTLSDVTNYVNTSKKEIDALVTKTTNEIDQTIEEATEEIKEAAVAEADKAVQETIGTSVVEAATSAERARIWAEGEQNEVQELGGELSSKEWALQASNSATSASQSATQAKTSETNAKSYADSIEPERFLNKEMITNCITEIPQDIKLELNNGTLTLKAGSQVYNGDGTVYTRSTDYTVTPSWGTGNGIFVFPVVDDSQIISFDAISRNLVFSGDVAPTFSGDYAYWFDTTVKRVKYTNNAGASWSENRALPLCLVSTNNNVITSIDQVFNGFGYIGSTVFALPGVKGLIPNGRNADGTLNNIEYTADKIYMRTFADTINLTQETLVFTPFNPEFSYFRGTPMGFEITQDGFIYSPYRDEILKGFVALSVSSTNGKITYFIPKLPFRAVDYHDFSEVAKTVESLPKHKVVSSLPSTREEDTFYYIPE